MGQVGVDQRDGQPVVENHVARVVVTVADELGQLADRAPRASQHPALHRAGAAPTRLEPTTGGL